MDQILQISWPSYITRDKAIAFVQSLIRKRHMENTDPMEYTDMAYVYFLQKLGSKYKEVMKPLLDAKILESTNYYRPGYYDETEQYIKGQCLSYRINPELLDDEVIKVVYKGEKRTQKCRDAVTIQSKQIMRQIRIPDLNSRELIEFVKRSLSDERILRMIKVDDQIKDTHVHIKGQNHPVNKESINLRSKNLIKDGKYCHIEHLDIYIKRKRRHLTQAYCDQLLRIKHRNVYADRNDTNLRLDSNLTNLKGDFMSLLQIDGQRLSQVDLKNSQFRIFVYLLEEAERRIMYANEDIEAIKTKFNLPETAKSEFKIRLGKGEEIEGKPVTLLSILFDEYCVQKVGVMRSLSAEYKDFKKLVKTGKLYEHIQRLVWAETGKNISRKEAKGIMFTIAFSSHRYQPQEKQIMRKYFPNVIALIDGFKKAMIEAYANEECKIKNEGLFPPAGRAGINNDDCRQTPPPPSAPCHDRQAPPKGDRLNISQNARDKGNASFAILLQQAESLIFIDSILAKCHQRGIKALSKHDSIVCRQSDKHKVTKIVCKVLNELMGKASYVLDIDGEVFQLKAKRKSRMHRVATEFVMTLFGMENRRANAPPESPEAIMEPACRTGRNACPPGREECRINNEIMSNELSGSQARYAATHPCPLLQREGVERSALLADGKIRNPRIAAMKRRIMGE